MSAMGLKKCPVCGEKYADTYKRCPFCEEEANPRQARQPKRNEGGGRRLARRTYEEDTPRPLYGGEEGPAYEGRRARGRTMTARRNTFPAAAAAGKKSTRTMATTSMKTTAIIMRMTTGAAPGLRLSW